MRFYRDTWIEVNLDAIYSNVRNIKKHYAKDKKMFAVVKADGYGHGAIMVARAAIEAGADSLAVATLDEAIELRESNITVPILLLGNMRKEDVNIAARYNITITVHNLNWLKSLNDMEFHSEEINVHFKLDTGMHRIGLLTTKELIEAKEYVDHHDFINLTGIYTHMATSEEDDESYYMMQKEKFIDMLSSIDSSNLLIHLANSASTIRYHHDFTNAVRAGILIYGLLPKKDLKIDFHVKQAINLYAKLIHVKSLPKGSKVSYNGIYETSGDEEWIGTLAIGYADGWDRRMVDGEAYIDGHFCEIVGRICMDQTMIKMPKQYPEGTIVELIGPHIHVDEVSHRINTINYQTVCLLSDRLPRLYRQHGRIIKTINKRLNKGEVPKSIT